jgi:hypothetical protein
MMLEVVIGWVLSTAHADLSIDQQIQTNLSIANSSDASPSAIALAARNVFVYREAKFLCAYAEPGSEAQCINAAISLKNEDLQSLCKFSTQARNEDCINEARLGESDFKIAQSKCSKLLEAQAQLSPNYSAGSFGTLLDKVGIPKDKKNAMLCSKVMLERSDQLEAQQMQNNPPPASAGAHR